MSLRKCSEISVVPFEEVSWFASSKPKVGNVMGVDAVDVCC